MTRPYENCQLNYHFVHSTVIGYGRMGSFIAQELRKLGVTISDVLSPAPPNKDGSAATVELHPGETAGRHKVVCWATVPTHAQGWWRDQIPVIQTMWEATRLPESFTETLHNFDTVIVPSPQNLELFGAIHPNVKYVPLGVDPQTWHPIERTPPGAEFRFLNPGSGKRKGGDLVEKAFKKLWPRGMHFGDNPIPTLTFKSPKGAQHYGERISTVGGHIPGADEIALYASAHCVVCPSRGEGFGLQPLQAIAQGCPTILTNAHGHGSYAFLGIPITAKTQKADYFVFGEAGEWWEPDFDELCQMMEDVYNRWDYYAEEASLRASLALNSFTWERTARGLVEAIGPERMVAYDGTDEWFEPEQMLYPIVTNADHAHEVAGKHYAYKKGVEYYEIADIKRILFEAGKLDPCCLDGGGLAPNQVVEIGAYRAQHADCPTCGHTLNEGVACI